MQITVLHVASATYRYDQSCSSHRHCERRSLRPFWWHIARRQATTGMDGHVTSHVAGTQAVRWRASPA